MEIYYNGIIYLNDEEASKASAMAVEDGIIKAVGTNQEILSQKSSQDKVINLEGRLVMPGFVDSHLHLLEYAEESAFIDLTSAKSLENLLEIMKEALPKAIEQKRPLQGFGFDNNYWDVPEMPQKEDLDKISTEIPVTVRRTCHHVTVCNTCALEFCGMLESHFNGNVYEDDQYLMVEKLREFGELDFKEMILTASLHAASKGITEVHTDDLELIPKELYGKSILDAYMELDKEGKLPIRIYQQCYLPTIERLRAFLDAGYKTGYSTGHFTIGPLKLFADGALGSRTAALREGYLDDPTNFGLLNFTDQEIDNLIDLANKSDCQVAIHGIGDRVIDQIISAIEKALTVHPREDHRHGIVHCQITHPSQLKKMQDLGIMAYIQPVFVKSDQWITADRVGEELAKTSYDWRTMADMGIHLGCGSDCPIEPFDILPNMYYAIMRKNPEQETGWYPDHALTFEEAVRGFTLEGAYAAFAEKYRGKLQPGFVADFCIIDRDITSLPPEELMEANVLMTFVDGKRIY